MSKGSGQIVRRYAAALYELAVENKKVAELREEASLMIQIFDKSILDFFVNPQFKIEQKTEVINTLSTQLKTSETMNKFLQLMLENSRMQIIVQVLKSFITRAEENLKIARIEVVSAQPLDASEIKKFKDALTQTLQRTIEISQSVDPTLKAGSIVKFGNTILDASLQTRLSNLKESLSVGV